MIYHTPALVVLLIAVSPNGALRQDASDAVELRDADLHDTYVERSRPYERLCCLQAVEPIGGLDDTGGDPNVRAIHVDVVKETAKCVLVMFPIGCQGSASPSKCTAACTEAFKNNPAWYEKVSLEAERQLESTQTLSAKEHQVAEAEREKAMKTCKTAETAEEAEAQKKKEHDVQPLFDQVSEAVITKQDDEVKEIDLSEVSIRFHKLEREVEQKVSDYDAAISSSTSAADECTSNATAAYETVVAKTVAANNKASQTLEAWQKKLESVRQQKESETNASLSELGSVGACESQGKIKDCCCSLREPAAEDGSHAEGQAMRVKAGQFAHWDNCFAAQPYSSAPTSLFGLLGGCSHYTKCDACWKLLCPGGRMCP